MKAEGAARGDARPPAPFFPAGWGASVPASRRERRAPASQPDAADERDHRGAENHPRQRAPAPHQLFGHPEHQAAVGILVDALERGNVIKVLSRVRQQQPQQPAVDQIRHGLPETGVRFCPGQNLAAFDAFIIAADARRHLRQIFGEPQALQIVRHAPARLSLQNLLFDRLVIDRLAGQHLGAGPDKVALILRAPGHALGHAVEMLVRLEHRFQTGARGWKWHDAHHVGRQV